ncbi:MAG: HipA domain-containing protein [Rhodoferax sp.]|nr:HipA domain-containing protein [Rhodoferax sp.]
MRILRHWLALRVRDVLSDRKYQGSYQRNAELLRQLQLHSHVMVRNGDAHLKNFGVLYRSSSEVWLAPMFDVVTTTIDKYTRHPGGPELEDYTLALKIFAGKHHTRTYPDLDELLDFGRRICGVNQSDQVVASIAQAMRETLAQARQDDRIPASLVAKMQTAWEAGMAYAA